MKVKVIKDAWYQNKRLYPGDIINFEGSKLPSWVKPLQDEPAKQAVPATIEQQDEIAYKSEDNDPLADSQPSAENPEKTAYDSLPYRELRALAVQKGIPVEGNPKKDELLSLIEQFDKAGE
jgi:hypothetical protein